MDDSPDARLLAFRSKTGLEQRELAMALGVSQSAISFAETGTRPISKRLIERLKERFNLSPNWLLYGSGEMYVLPPDDERTHRSAVVTAPDTAMPAHGDVRLDGEDFQLVRRFDGSVSAGQGTLVPSDRIVDNIAFTRSWLLRQSLNGDLCGLISVRGDSMSPTIRDGALVLVHFPESTVDDGKIYAVSVGEMTLVKRVVRQGDGVLLLSDNPTHPPQRIGPDEVDRFVVHGRVKAVVDTL